MPIEDGEAETPFPLGMTEGFGKPLTWYVSLGPEAAAVCDEAPPRMDCVSNFQPAQSSSAMPSSSETMGYFSIHLPQYSTIASGECADLSDFLKMYFPLGLS